VIIKFDVEQTISIGIADGHLLFREGLITLLKTNSSFKIIFDVNTSVDLLDHLKINAPDIILFDNHLPGLKGLNLLQSIDEEFPETKIIVLAAQFIVSDVIECIGKGARAFLTKDCGLTKLEQAILRVITFGSYYDNDVAVTIARYLSNKPKTSFNAIELLTKKEIKILDLISRNKNNYEIADMLVMSVRTLEGHRSRILAKTGLKNFAAIISWAFQNRLISGNSDLKSQ
jgi:DNA-binding NarL/FixJ family response regulator